MLEQQLPQPRDPEQPQEANFECLAGLPNLGVVGAVQRHWDRWGDWDYRELVRLIKADEARHIAFGLDLLVRTIQENPFQRLTVIGECIRLFGPVSESSAELTTHFAQWKPFGLDAQEFRPYAREKLRSRLKTILWRARPPQTE